MMIGASFTMRPIKSRNSANKNGIRASTLLGPTLRALREAKGLSQRDIEERTGLLRSYVSNVEHSHTVPSIDTLERMARALDVPLYRLFCRGPEPKRTPEFASTRKSRTFEERDGRDDLRYVRLLRRQIPHLSEEKKKLLLFMARTMARAHRKENRGKSQKV
jgi:transcriptional regulator with XRE-family HTH domain